MKRKSRTITISALIVFAFILGACATPGKPAIVSSSLVLALANEAAAFYATATPDEQAFMRQSVNPLINATVAAQIHYNTALLAGQKPDATELTDAYQRAAKALDEVKQ